MEMGFAVDRELAIPKLESVSVLRDSKEELAMVKVSASKSNGFK
jgi:hypothetical protein